MSQIRIDNLSKQFAQTQVLKQLSLTIENGEFLVLVGASGCGKSTLLRILAGLEQPSCGALYCDGEDIARQSPRERNFSMIFQSYALFPHMSVAENIRFGMKIRGEKQRDHQAIFDETVAMLRLTPLLNRRPKALSGGQRQRVAMARAIVRRPRLFLMDEPLSNLDAKLRGDVRDAIMALHQKLKTTTVYVTHDQIEAMTMADRIVVLDQGVIQQVGTPEWLYQTPANLFVARFIGSPTINTFKIASQNGWVCLAGCRWEFKQDEPESMVWVGLRPEHIRVGVGPRGSGQFPARLRRQELLGHVRLLHLESGYGPLQIFHDTQSQPLRDGDEFNCYFMPEQIHLFSATTTQRLTIKESL
ncbi:ABC transporter ATP-binding protein [Celerinatantimonas sp. YJH-8]|uniref:ABC transporter ATP-binding protein n=1 Tax=Celerinatantimonas sp. YJH-8 TaxID=3228714 RepID=UPI0038BE567D